MHGNEEGDGRCSLLDSGRAADRQNFVEEAQDVTGKDGINAKDDVGYRSGALDGGRRGLETYDREGEEEDGDAAEKRNQINDSSEDEDGKVRNIIKSERRSDSRQRRFRGEDDKRKQSHEKPVEDDRVSAETRGGETEGSKREDSGDDDEPCQPRKREYRSCSTKDEDKQIQKDFGRRCKDGGHLSRRSGCREDAQRYTSRYRDQRERDGRSSRREGDNANFDKRKDRRKEETSPKSNQREGEEIPDRKFQRHGDNDDANRRIDERAERIGRETKSEHEKIKTRQGEKSRGGSNGNLDKRRDLDKKTEHQNHHKTTNLVDVNVGRSGGIYIPPFKMAQMMKNVEDKGGEQYQRLTWDALRKSINGLVNKL